MVLFHILIPVSNKDAPIDASNITLAVHAVSTFCTIGSASFSHIEVTEAK